MGWQHTLSALSVAAAIAAASGSTVKAQAVGKYLAPKDQVIAIRAGRLFDSKSGNLLSNQVVIVRGDRIADVGADVQVPSGARVIDLSAATVLPGMIDAHVHVNTNGTAPNLAVRALRALANAQIDLAAGFTTVLDMDSRGTFYTVDLRDAVNAGIVQGPRMQVVGESLNQRATNYYPDNSTHFFEGFTENKNVNSPWLARAAVREAKLHGVDYIKIYTTQDFAGTLHMWNPDGTLVASPSLTLEEVEAIVEEAHRLGLKVACHTYGGEGLMSCLTAGVDAPNHLLELDDAGVKILLAKKLPFVPTVDDLVANDKGDLAATGGKNSRLRLVEQATRRAVAAGVPIVFGSGATSVTIPHGKQGDQFAYYAKWGLGPVRALQTAYLDAARMLNYNWEKDIGSIEKGKFADIIAVSGNPIADLSEMERVKFVMKAGALVHDELSAAAAPHTP
jgi:imidazolonepropionase-like amidohydrolase